MSRSAGTLITTNNATYIPPRFQPGYNGHVPTMKFDYGETYGNATAKYFQDYRSQSLSNSNSNYCKGGYFPTFYTHQPDLVIGNRTRTRDRWLSAPRYSLTTVNYDRQQELIGFDNSAQAHRENYKDKSGTSKRVDYFMLPNKAEDQLKKHLPFMVLSTRYTDAINIPDMEHVARRRPIVQQKPVRSSQRDREMRDVVFEKR